MSLMVAGKPDSAFKHNLRAFLDALVVIALCNLAVTLLVGGYNVRIHGLQLKSSDFGRPLFILTSVLVLRALAALPGASRQVRRFIPWGVAGAALGLGVYAFGALPIPEGVWVVQVILVAALAALCYVLAWLAYSEGYAATTRLVVVAAFVMASAGLAASHSRPSVWAKTFGRYTVVKESGSETPADKEGLLLVEGRGVALVKYDIGHNSRDAMVIAPARAAVCPAALPNGATLAFSVAARPSASRSTITVSCGPARSLTTIWEEQSSNMSANQWRDVSVPVAVAGDSRIVFSVTGDADGDSVVVANPRIEPSAVAAKPLNVIIFLVDVLRADHLGVYGYSRPTSPEIDRLAAGGVVFENCIAQAPWTLPSVASLFTSLNPTGHGFQMHDFADPADAAVRYESVLSDRLTTLARALRRGGRYVGTIQANPLVMPERGFAQAVNEYDHIGYAGWQRGRKEEGSSCDILVTRAIDWLGKHKARPFFLYLHTIDCHQPLTIVPDMERFGTDEMSRYDATIAFTSVQFARLFDFLKAQRLLDNTVVILTADHGQQFLEHGRDGHAMDCRIEEVHVPLIFWAPGVFGGRVRSLVRLIDVAPTILEMAGLEPIPYAVGASLVPALEGHDIPSRPAWSELMNAVPGGGTEHITSLATGEYRFVHTTNGSHRKDRWEIFDTRRDPEEYVNLSGDRGDLVVLFRKELVGYASRERDLHTKLVPEEARKRITSEELRKLEALGYIDPGAPAADGARTGATAK